MTKMKPQSSEHEMIRRAKNFHWNIGDFEKSVYENESFFFDLEILKDEIVRFGISEPVKDLEKSDLLYRIFSKIYRLIKIPELDLQAFYSFPHLSDQMYEASLFTTLCLFLHSTKRIRGTSIRDFVLHNHPLDFNNIESSNYRTSLLDSESDRLRKARNRLLSNSSVYIKRSQWAGMPKDTEYEWRFFYTLDDADEVIRDTYKRIGNLYTGIDTTLDLTKNTKYSDKIKDAYKKFLSKLHKIKYENVLTLYQKIYSHINENQEFYGLNIYRFEKRLMPYYIISDVKKLISFQDMREKIDYLMKTVVLRSIPFPKVYEEFIALPCSSNKLALLAGGFSEFIENIATSSCLIIDELVEKGIFGSDWEHLFRDMLNAMTEKVFYEPAHLDFTVTAESQTEYEALLAAPVFTVLREVADISLDFGVYF